MVSKGDLGGGYLIAVGVGVLGAVSSGVLIPLGRGALVLPPSALLAICSGVLVASGFLVTGFSFRRGAFEDDRVWNVAVWSAVGLGLPTLLTVYVVVFHGDSLGDLGWRSVAIVNVAGGGIVGVLVGAVVELRAEHRRSRSLNQRNLVFLRLFRHDIRTSLTAMLGHVDLLDAEPGTPERSIRVLRDHLDRILRLSDAARELDALASTTERRPVDLVSLVRGRAAAVERDRPDATIETALPPAAHVRADDLLASVVGNLLDNAVDHADGPPVVLATIERVGRSVVLVVEDDGPGFSADELAVHERDVETALEHSDGVGLWLVRWIVDSYGGDVALENAPAGGARVTVTLPAARAPAGDGPR